jgi:hypothetical protein
VNQAKFRRNKGISDNEGFKESTNNNTIRIYEGMTRDNEKNDKEEEERWAFIVDVSSQKGESLRKERGKK